MSIKAASRRSTKENTYDQIVPHEQDPLEMLLGFYDGLSEEEVVEIERIILDRSNWFPELDWSWLDDEGEEDRDAI